MEVNSTNTIIERTTYVLEENTFVNRQGRRQAGGIIDNPSQSPARGRPVKNDTDHVKNVLGLLRLEEKSYGYAISKKLDIAPGTLYPLLERLEDRGFLSTAWEENKKDSGRPRRCVYTLTQQGKEHAENLL